MFERHVSLTDSSTGSEAVHQVAADQQNHAQSDHELIGAKLPERGFGSPAPIQKGRKRIGQESFAAAT